MFARNVDGDAGSYQLDEDVGIQSFDFQTVCPWIPAEPVTGMRTAHTSIHADYDPLSSFVSFLPIGTFHQHLVERASDDKRIS